MVDGGGVVLADGEDQCGVVELAGVYDVQKALHETSGRCFQKTGCAER